MHPKCTPKILPNSLQKQVQLKSKCFLYVVLKICSKVYQNIKQHCCPPIKAPKNCGEISGDLKAG